MRLVASRVLLALSAVWFALAAVLFLAPRAHAQTLPRLELRTTGAATPAPVDSVWLIPGDTVPLRVRGVSVAGGTVTPANVTVAAAPDCLRSEAAGASVMLWEPAERPACDAARGWWIISATVNGTPVRDSAWVDRPMFDVRTTRALCMTAAPAAMLYRSSDSAVVVAIQGRDQRIAMTWASDAPVVDFGWQSGTKTLRLSAIACLPGYEARDVTRSPLTRWRTANAAVATVDGSGVVTWKGPQPFQVAADWPVRAP